MTFSKHRLPSEADQELLSAYLDNELSVSERLSFERRLQQEPMLQTELAELRTLKALVSDLPTLTPPRSFTLDPATVGKPKGLPLFSILRLGSALATVLLALTLSFDIFGATAPQAATQQSDTASAPSAAVLAQEAAPAEGMPSPKLESGGNSGPAAAILAATPAAEATTNAQAERYGEPSAEAQAAEDSTTAMSPAAPAVGSAGSSSPDTTDIASQPPLPPSEGLSALRWLQIALAAVAIATGMGALLAWQQRR